MANLNDWAAIAADLEALEGDRIFDLSGPLGSSLVSALTAAIRDQFDAEVDPDGVPWPVLSSEYGRWKEQHYPGANILVREGDLRAGIDGETTTAPDVAIWTYGTDQENRAKAGWMEEGDPAANRPPRRFIDLVPEAVAESDRRFDDAFEKGTTR